ncbi:hypothetical protein NPIL_605631 [Nephila pilipes]|uniref:Uncharacterized protein n=1 Tax=Nephila pilipes TaxID=299642 RepID=A0A8X6PUN8_NEPPI|nr:hypothetical protein NPIL_605631 [Nephila pilipes]
MYNTIKYEGLYKEGFGTLNGGDLSSPFSSEKRTPSVAENSQCYSKTFSPWNTEAEKLDSLLDKFSHIFSAVRYDEGRNRIEPEKVVLKTATVLKPISYFTSE